MTVEPRAPNVTIVIIFLDAEAFFAEAIDSVLAQTYRDFELILVDDGSTDGSTAIAKDYAARHPALVRYTEHDGHRNLGMSASRNRGVRLGRGRYVSFLDADDIWLADRLRRFVEAIELYPAAGMVYGATLYWYSWAIARGEKPLEPDVVSVFGLPTDQLLSPPAPLTRWLEASGSCLPGIGSLIVRREAFESIGGFEHEFRGMYEDQAFLSKMVLAHQVAIIPDVLDYYRQHPSSACHRGIVTGEYHPEQLNPARQRYLSWLAEHIQRQGIEDRALWRALRHELWPYRSRLNGFLYTARRNAPHDIKMFARRWLPRPLRKPLRWLREKVRRPGWRSNEIPSSS